MEVHPRWRGERFDVFVGGPYDNGSSPLARGTGEKKPPLRSTHRFIPAGAGNGPV